MTIKALEEIGLYGGGALVLIMTLIQVSPIKFNPWSYIGKRIGRFVNSEVIEKVDAITDDLQTFKNANAEEWASLSRRNILHFGDELQHGVAHSQEHFQQVLLDIDKYEKFCCEHPSYRNNVAHQTIELIKKTYQECLEENKFI